MDRSQVTGYATAEGIYFLDPNPNGVRTVLLLHGLGADCESWPGQMASLSRAGWRPLALDLPGFGNSPAYANRWTIERTAIRIFEFCQALDLKRVSLAGISMGGTVVIQMALEYPGLIDRLILINTFAHLKPKSGRQALYFLRRFLLVAAGDRQEQAEFVAWRIFPYEGQRELRDELKRKILQANGRVYQEAMVSLAFFRAMKHLSDLTMPTLVISGEEDTTVALENQIALWKGIKGARHVIIPGGGHGVTVDHPDEVNAALLDFLSEE